MKFHSYTKLFFIIATIVFTFNFKKNTLSSVADSFFKYFPIALMAILWVSLAAPLSWFIIFKGHSYIHTHMNPIVWYMPFMLLGFVLTGSTGWYLLQERYRNKKKIQEPIVNDSKDK